LLGTYKFWGGSGLAIQKRVDSPENVCQDMGITEKGGGPAKMESYKRPREVADF